MRLPLGSIIAFGAEIVCAGVFTGCVSVPQYRYYTIDMQPRGQVESSARISSITIDVNQALSRPEILVRTSPTQVEYYALDRWASGLEEQVAEKLKTEFGQLPSDLPALLLHATLMAFEQVDTPSGAEVRVKLEVDTVPEGFAPRFTKIYERTEPAAASSAAAVVEALSRATEAIAVELGKDLSEYVMGVSAN